MKPLDPKQTERLQNVYGLIGAGNHAAARAELDSFPAELRGHPGVLTTRLSLCETARQWEECVTLANQLIAVQPDMPIHWVQRSVFLRDLGRTQEAWDQLLPAAAKFPTLWMIPYNLARYACKLGNVDQARNRLNAALELVDADAIKAKAIAEPDLEPLWPELRRL